MVEKWQKISSHPLGHYRIFQLRQDISRSPRTGQEHPFFILEAPDWINIIPITPEGKVILIHQYRQGTEAVTLEIPGGMMDPEDTSPLESALRELREETGYEAEEAVFIGSVDPNPAFINNQCHTFLALGARKKHDVELDSMEDIVVEAFDLAEVPALIRNGRISHALVIAAFYHLERYQETKE